DEIVQAKCGEDSSAAQRHLFRESLRALVRFARAEQLAEIRQNALKLTGNFEIASRKRWREEDGMVAQVRQKQLEFNKQDTPHLNPACGDSCDE
ncbi:MAG: hypothetical protein K0S28_578, partial [Paucimonas sp.]|nr:hypothetical protein [Paucimonas sp.]